MTEKKILENTLEKWQNILKLQDWDIKLHFVEKEWRKSGDIKIDECNKEAVVMLNCVNPRVKNTEEVILHELLHLKLWNMDQLIERLINGLYGTDESDPRREMIYEEFMITLEKTTQDLTRGYMSLGGEEAGPSFGYVEEKVRQELADN